MARWRQAPWPVLFVVCTVLFAVLAVVWAEVADADASRLAAAAPFFGAGMTWWFVRQRGENRSGSGQKPS